jgi:RNA polymerase sigma factor (TIGR02999 family)
MADFLAGYLGKQALRSKPDMPVTLQSTMTLESKGSGPSSGQIRDSAAIKALAEDLVPLFYDELRAIARRTRAKVGRNLTMQTTALVNETYLKLRTARGWNDDAHFLCAAALAMRHVLVNHAHARIAAKRGAGAEHLPLEAADYVTNEQDDMLINLNEALAKLAAEAPRLAQVVECRYFGGFDDSSTARALQLSERTVRRDWVLARAWLHRELQLPGDSSALSC